MYNCKQASLKPIIRYNMMNNMSQHMYYYAIHVKDYEFGPWIHTAYA